MTFLRKIRMFFSLLWEIDPLGGRVSAGTAWEVAGIFYERGRQGDAK